jgi:cytochrome c
MGACSAVKRAIVINPISASGAIAAAIISASLVTLAQAGTTPTAAAVAPQGNARHGETLYQGCAACHSIDDNDIGPKHRGVVGRRAGSIPDYVYSPALEASGITWDEKQLDRWLTNPSALVPGTKMFFEIEDPQARADIIAYLKEQK